MSARFIEQMSMFFSKNGTNHKTHATTMSILVPPDALNDLLNTITIKLLMREDEDMADFAELARMAGGAMAVREVIAAMRTVADTRTRMVANDPG